MRSLAQALALSRVKSRSGSSGAVAGTGERLELVAVELPTHARLGVDEQGPDVVLHETGEKLSPAHDVVGGATVSPAL